MTAYRSTLTGRDGFAQLVHAEWTKLRSVPGWMAALGAAVVLTVGVSLLTALGSGGSSPGGGERDAGRFDGRALTGDGELAARVVAQDGDASAKAGVMMRDGDAFAAVMVTPGGEVQVQTDGSGAVGVARAGTPRWLKLTRAGGAVRAADSADGVTWRPLGTVRSGLPRTVQAGPFVATPDAVDVGRRLGGETVDAVSTVATATFAGLPDRWPATVRLTGSGDIGPDPYADDTTALMLSGALVGIAAIVALGVVFVASEYERGTIRTTFAASPRRVRVLGAKAVVLGAASLAAGLVASLGAFLLSGPVLRARGIEPSSLLDGSSLRAVAGSAALIAVVAVLSLAVATITRRTASAVAIVLLALLVPQLVASGLPAGVAVWVERLTPAAGFAVQETVHRYDTAIAPLGGLAVLCGYALLALAGATWRLRGRDA